MQLIASAGVILAIVLWGLVAPGSLETFFKLALAEITRDFGWLYLWLVLGLVVMALLLALSRYGDLKLGADDEEPQFSIGSWFAMRFAAGMGIGLVFWGVAEPEHVHQRAAVARGAAPLGLLQRARDHRDGLRRRRLARHRRVADQTAASKPSSACRSTTARSSASSSSRPDSSSPRPSPVSSAASSGCRSST